jgi:hypothetical protein
MWRPMIQRSRSEKDEKAVTGLKPGLQRMFRDYLCKPTAVNAIFVHSILEVLQKLL